MIRIALMPLCALALLAAGCGSDDDKSSASPSSEKAMKEKKAEAAAMREKKAEAAMKAGKGAKVKVVSSQYGRVLADSRGQAFYLFAREKSSKSRCYGACAKAWPPVITKGKPRAGPGSRKSLLGTTKRRNGKLQLTYAGHPMYYFETDSPGVIKCQNVSEFGGLWLVVRPNGRAVG